MVFSCLYRLKILGNIIMSKSTNLRKSLYTLIALGFMFQIIPVILAIFLNLVMPGLLSRTFGPAGGSHAWI